MNRLVKPAAALLGSALASRFLGLPGAALGAGGAAFSASQGDPETAAALGLGAAVGLLMRDTTSPWGPLPLKPAMALTLWNGNSLTDAWQEQAAVFARVQPQVILMHVGIGGGADAAEVAAAARELVPNLRVWVQVSADPAMSTGANAAVQTGLRVVQATGAEAVSWNGERAFKTADGARVARAIVQGFADTGSNAVQMQTAYGDPTLHSSYPWSAWFEPGGCLVSLAQDYPFGDDRRSGTVPDGTLSSRIARNAAGWQDAVQEGLVPASVVRGTYIPSAHLETNDIVRACQGIPYVAAWPWHGRYDENALRAFETLRAARG